MQADSGQQNSTANFAKLGILCHRTFSPPYSSKIIFSDIMHIITVETQKYYNKRFGNFKNLGECIHQSAHRVKNLIIIILPSIVLEEVNKYSFKRLEKHTF